MKHKLYLIKLKKAFPRNNILLMFDGIELGVIKRDEK